MSQVIASCRTYQKNGTALLVQWSLQAVALCLAYYQMITKNKVQAKYWPRFIIIIQVVALLETVLLDIVGEILVSDAD